MWTSNYLLAPTTLAVVLFFIGLGGPWRRTVGYVGCTYAAMVIASQHYLTLTSFAARAFGLADSSLTRSQQSSLIFAITLAVLSIVLLAMYSAAWRPARDWAAARSKGSGWSRLLRGLICASVGWMIGSIALAAMLTAGGVNAPAGASTATLGPDIVFGLNEVAGYLVRPWLPGELPPVLQ